MYSSRRTRPVSFVWVAALAGSAGLSLVVACGGSPPPAANASVRPAPDRAAGLAAFETVRSVLQHPRCQNCHPAGDAPLQGDDSHVHAMNVRRGPEGNGLVGEECSTCHGPANPPSSYGAHVPPGSVKPWHMPAPDTKLVFVGLTPGALCEQVKDPARNGGKDSPALRAHLEDPLVVWGWSPGFGRAAIPVAREGFLTAWETWTSAGTPCPEIAATAAR
jgi:cytochrome c5